jgi:hypothetical protein
MAKAVFGRHYVSDKDMEEVRRSLNRAKAPRKPAATASKRKKKERG